MFFADFIQRLRPIIGDGRSIPEYVRFFLMKIIIDPTSENELGKVTMIGDIFNNKLSVSARKSYYYGKTEGKGKNKRITGDNINKLARSIVNYLDIEKFKNCFENLQFNLEATNKLKDSFKDVFSGESYDKIVDRLANELKTIIDSAAGKRNDNTSSSSIVSDTTDPTIIKEKVDDKRTISKSDKEEIRKIIREIHDSMKGMGYWYEENKEDISFKEKYSKYTDLNQNLLSFGLVYPFIDSLKKLPKQMLRREDFFACKEGVEQRVLEYKGLLDDLIQELLKIPE